MGKSTRPGRSQPGLGWGEAEVGAAGGPPLATGGPASGGEGSVRCAPGGGVAVVGLALRFALNARPTGSQGFAPGKANGKDKNQNDDKDQNKDKEKRGHF